MLKILFSVPPLNRRKHLFVFLLFFSGIHSAYSQADFAIQGASVSPTSVAVGGSIYASGSIYNLGITAGAISNMGFYLSTNKTLDAADTLIGSSTGGSLSNGGSSRRYVTLTIPSNTIAGNYYFLFVADPANEITETNESNNVSYVALRITTSGSNSDIQKSDLIVATPILDKTDVNIGNTVTITSNVSNIGNTAAPAGKVSYYLSSDDEYEFADFLIAESDYSALAPGASVNSSITFTVPAWVLYADYHLFAKVDYRGTADEIDESNNISNAASLTIKDPLGVKELSEEHKLTLLPNPATDKLTIKAKGFQNGERSAEIIVYSAAGHKLTTRKATIINHELNTFLDVANLSHGLYLIYIQVGDSLTIRKIIVQ